MVLVAYSDSEGSDDERPSEKPQQHSAKPEAPPPTKAGFQSIVDKSNPRKIRVNLQENETTTSGDRTIEEPVPKKARLGGGAFSGFNSILPPPKKPAGQTESNTSGRTRKAFSLKTGAEPGFDRAGDAELRAQGGLNSGIVENGVEMAPNVAPAEHKVEIPRQGNPMMFKPLSVARKPQAKRPPSTTQGKAKTETINTVQASQPAPKVKLFSLADDERLPERAAYTSQAYEPLIHGAKKDDDLDDSTATSHEISVEGDLDYTPTSMLPTDETTMAAAGSQSLDAIAADLNLSAAAKRQLFGRQGRSGLTSSAVNVVNFNTDEEYAANEALRASGGQVQHNPVKAIAPGKHSLKQLVNAAAHQKDALEEHFATGKRNKKEAGSKYGW